MRINILMQENTNEFHLGTIKETDDLCVDFGELNILQPDRDYNNLINKPSINSIVLEGALTAKELGLENIYYDTTANWNSQQSLIAQKGCIYIYSDYSVITVGTQPIPLAGIKIGDGTSYLIDVPFITDQATAALARHIANMHLHVSPTEKTFWNNKVSSYLTNDEPENLVLSKTNFVTEGDIYNG